MQIDPSSLAVNAPLLLRPAMHPLVADLLSNGSELLRQLVHGLGSPLNIMLPDLPGQNAASFQRVLDKHNVAGRIFFAHKASQSDSLMRQLAVTPGIHVDVASIEELRHALACGFDGTRLQATGPKSSEFLTLCLLHGLTINVDSGDELLKFGFLQSRFTSGRKAKVLLRVSGFDHSPLAKASRFGIPFTEIADWLTWLAEDADAPELLGFSFHLDSTSLQDRVAAIESCLQLFETAIDLGLSPRVLDIGGGFRVSYLAHEQDWHNYVSAMKQSVLGKGPSLTWQKASFGLSAHNGQLRGAFNTYGFYEKRPGAAFLDDILSHPLPGHDGLAVGEVLASNGIELWIEPGRSLIDQAGLTLARVVNMRQSSQGHDLVLLDMKRSDLAFLDQEMFVDPVVVTSPERRNDLCNARAVFLTGKLCLESDLIYRHLTVLRLPRMLDETLLAFINTAAYAMDFSAGEAIMHPRARKVAVYKNHRDEFVWTMDDQFPFLTSCGASARLND